MFITYTLVPRAGLEPASSKASDFKSDEFTNFSTRALGTT